MQRFNAGRRIEVQELADELGISRMSVYRWFGDREAVIGAAIAHVSATTIRRARRGVRGHGAEALLRTFDAVNRALVASEGLRTYLRNEGHAALRVLTAGDGPAHLAAVDGIEAIVLAEVEGGHFITALAPRTLAYSIVRLAEAHLYNDAAADLRGDVDHLREVEAALLGLSR